MRPYGTSEQLRKRRAQAFELLKQGSSVKEVAGKLGVSERSVEGWRRERKHPREKSERPPGRPAYLTKAQLQQLEKELCGVPMLMAIVKITGIWAGSGM